MASFVLVGFIASQVYLSGIIFDKDSSISSIKCKLADVCSLLDSEKCKNKELSQNNADLSKQIQYLNAAVSTLQTMFDSEQKLKEEDHNSRLSIEEKLAEVNKQLSDVTAALALEHQNLEKQKEALEIIFIVSYL